MTDWAWVGFAFGVVYITLAVYVISLRSRLSRLRGED